MKKLIIAAVLAGFAGSAHAEADVARASGGSIQTKLGHGIVINEDSSMEREWIIINDPNLPATLHAPTGVRTGYKSSTRYDSGGYQYRAKFDLTAKEDLVAIQVNFMLFDLWGNQTRLLSSTDVIDIDEGKKITLKPRWSVHSENEVSEYYASIAYIARIRTKAGELLAMPNKYILDIAQEFSEDVSDDSLEPEE